MGYRSKILNIIQNSLLQDEDVSSEILKLMFEKHGANHITKTIVDIQQLESERLKSEREQLLQGLQDSVHINSHIFKELLEGDNKNVRIYKNSLFTNMYLPHFINIMKSHYPKGMTTFHSSSSKWIFSKFKNVIFENINEYREGGESYSWAKRFGHLDYMELVIKNNK